MMPRMTMLSGWGRFPQFQCKVSRPRTAADLRHLLAEGSVIARGNGRAYGDSALNIRATADMRHFNHMLAFDAASGQLTAEAGVMLGDIISAFLPRGWFPPVTPGTKFVTLGGMIAADVHGKNHHRHGSFGGFLDWIDVMQADGQTVRCSKDENRDLFEWTIGGMGLTGIILRAAFRLARVETGWVRQTVIPAVDLESTMAAFEAAEASAYSVAWIDCLSSGPRLGRSLLLLGEHASPGDLHAAAAANPFAIFERRKLSVPFGMPSIAHAAPLARAFNAMHYWRGARDARARLVDWDRYFYPLDAILGWNRIYGRNGMVQFQCVLPLDRSHKGLLALLSALSASRQAPLLAVLKRMGKQDSRFSFPMEGYTLALDFPVSPAVLEFLSRLDQIAVEHGGRFYLAKDSRMAAATFHASEPRLPEFLAMRAEKTGTRLFASAQSERLGL